MMRTTKPYNVCRPCQAMLGRDFRLFIRGVPAALLIAVLLGLFSMLAAAALEHGTDGTYTLAPIAVVDEDGSFTSSIAISMISKQDFTAPLEVHKVKAAAAEQGLADGTYSAVLYLPDGYAGDILSGQQTAARLVISENAPLHGDVIELLCSFGQELLGTGQMGIFSGERLVLETAPERHSQYLRRSNARFLSRAMADPGIQRQELTYALTGVAPAEWYAVIYLAAFFQLIILGCFSLSRDWNGDMLRRLNAAGLLDREFLGSKVLIVFVFYALLAGGLVYFLDLPVTAANAAILASALLASACVGLALILILPRSQAVIAVTALTAVGLFASGGMVPRMELPRMVTAVGDFLPLGAAARSSAVLLGGNRNVLYPAACLLWAGLSWLVMRRAMVAARKGGHQ